VAAWTAAGDEPSEAAVCVVAVGEGPAPPPPPPGPPADPLTRTIQAAYDAEPDAGKRTQLDALRDFYQTAAVARSKDTSLTNYGLLFANLQVERRRVVADGQIIKVRNAVGEFLNQELGTDPKAPVDRLKAPATFERVAKALGGVK
jgi:hypothetical protein